MDGMQFFVYRQNLQIINTSLPVLSMREGLQEKHSSLHVSVRDIEYITPFAFIQTSESV
jgi:hypothetical protein